MASNEATTSSASASTLLPYVIVSAAIFLISYWSLFRRPGFPSKAPPVTRTNYPLVGDLGFWRHRHDWWLAAQEQLKTQDFSFHIGKHRVVGTNSDAGRELFFQSKDLGFGEGYAVLFGQAPDFADDEISGKEGGSQYFNTRLTQLLKREQFVKALPTLLSDVRSRLDDLAADPQGRTDPFDSIYKIVYLLTQRAVGASEIARDRKLQDTTLHLFETIERSTKPYQVMFPWLPSPALFQRYLAGTRMYMIFSKIVNNRKKNNHRKDDALQFLIDKGDDLNRIIAFTLGALFAGQLNSGINAAWVICYLAADPYWLSEVRKEVQATTDKFAPGPEPLVDRLGKLPLEAWEQSFPVIDICLRDSIRLQSHGTGFRKNMSGKPLPLGDQVVPEGGFMAYHWGEHHRNKEIWKDPLKWDPSRYLPDRAEDKKDKFAYLGWGLGRHPCLGMRFAKLEQNIITAFFCTMFDFSLESEDGTALAETVAVNTNNYTANKPDEKMYLRYSVRKEVL